MKKIFLSSLFLAVSFLFITAAAQDTNEWTKKKAKKWFKKKEWLGGLQLKPSKTVDKIEFARQYHLHKKYWDEAFDYLKNTDLNKLPKGKYPINGDNVFASVTTDSTKNFDKTNWESHRKYIDIQYVIDGEELIGVYPVSKATVTREYDEKKDAANYSADGKLYSAKPGTFFIFFPSNAHRPNITPGDNKVDKKIVIKVRYAE
ncbi:MAG TPA: YhcH/YjgK/YiaL family protein [Chitinophagaceae bacterium]|nr:YhcH/YjgK/YiaL family protein [Chitinophagaceae bacterium]